MADERCATMSTTRIVVKIILEYTILREAAYIRLSRSDSPSHLLLFVEGVNENEWFD